MNERNKTWVRHKVWKSVMNILMISLYLLTAGTDLRNAVRDQTLFMIIIECAL